MLTNEYLDDLFEGIKIEGEDYFYYFYVYQIPKEGVLLVNGIIPVGDIEHIIVCFTNKRLLFLEITMMGKYTGNMKSIDLIEFEHIKVKRGMIRTSIVLTSKNGKGNTVIKANSFTFGLSNQKKNLIALEKLY
ncbi:hypothetical protein P4493_04175 [Bacillus thuringiensis]|uniref:Bacterial PH domain protein n=3 Tax=Bacillus thuringiensis TaxID=1428 RepID=A0A0B5N896_BACTU|nr:MULTISPECIES: PH domain-containing protein [Bacillus]MEC2535473.1 hypothetical protein [Bacillus cereus]MED1153813.1 hypothetical protein [Bacillus paranthracis]OUB09328.1 hypothetical protein BK708_32910 [Bacillus thuringiensis serovar yunnanensis]AFQ30125.1 hypothetical protein BTF1_30122 [Bacillus thuringiensis HD-789]AJG73979.1 bacterial PH domain protein [Bacillus thuringiensis]